MWVCMLVHVGVYVDTCGCVLLQLKKVYGGNMEGVEAQEDMVKMREHAFSEVSCYNYCYYYCNDRVTC